jgi:hypothetical protein
MQSAWPIFLRQHGAALNRDTSNQKPPEKKARPQRRYLKYF